MHLLKWMPFRVLVQSSVLCTPMQIVQLCVLLYSNADVLCVCCIVCVM